MSFVLSLVSFVQFLSTLLLLLLSTGVLGGVSQIKSATGTPREYHCMENLSNILASLRSKIDAIDNCQVQRQVQRTSNGSDRIGLFNNHQVQRQVQRICDRSDGMGS